VIYEVCRLLDASVGPLPKGRDEDFQGFLPDLAGDVGQAGLKETGRVRDFRVCRLTVPDDLLEGPQPRRQNPRRDGVETRGRAGMTDGARRKGLIHPGIPVAIGPNPKDPETVT